MKTILLILFCVSVSYSQENDNKSFSINSTIGIALNNPFNFYFLYEEDYTQINPGPYVHLGLNYGPLYLVDLTQIYFRLSIGYTKVSTSEIKLNHFPSKAKLIIETYPILFWFKIQTATKLSPFIELGLGISNLHYNEKYPDTRLEASFNYWGFAYSMGGGLSYKLTSDINLSLGLQNIINEKEKLVTLYRGYRAGIEERNIIIAYYINLEVAI